MPSGGFWFLDGVAARESSGCSFDQSQVQVAGGSLGLILILGWQVAGGSLVEGQAGGR